MRLLGERADRGSPPLLRCAGGRLDCRETALITVGKKAQGYFRFRGYEIAESFSGFSDDPSYEDARTVAAHVAERFESGAYSEVHIAYTQFLSMGTQVSQVAQYMPLDHQRPRGDRGGRSVRCLRVRAQPVGDPRPASCPATPRPGSTPRCSTRPLPSTLLASGP